MIKAGMRIAVASVLALGVRSPLAGQSVHTPARGSAERRALMDALRERMQGELHKPMIFQVATLNVTGDWAFTEVELRRPDGAEFDYSATPLETYWRDGMVDHASFAVLHRAAGRWRVVRVAIGPTDVEWIGWDEELHAPKSIFPSLHPPCPCPRASPSG